MRVLERIRQRRQGTRVRTPTCLQMEAVECGAAALASILAYHGRIVPLEELRVKCGVSRDGVTAHNLILAAREYGLVGRGFKKGLDALVQMKVPVILFWNFNHFLVLEGVKDGWAYLNDPAVGPRRVDMDELNDAFTGVVLTFEKGPDFEKGGKAPSLVAALRTRLEGSETAVAFALLAGLALVVPGLVIPAFARVFVDKFLVEGMRTWIVPLLIGMGVTAALRGALTWLREYTLLRLETKLAASMSSQFFWHVLRLPVEFYAQRYSGEISSRVEINSSVARLLSGRLATTAIDVVMIVFFAALMFVYDWVLTLVGIVMVVGSLVAMTSVNRLRVDGNRRVLQEEGKYMGAIMGGLQNIETVKATSREPDLFSQLAGYQAKVVAAEQDLDIKTLVLTATPNLLSGATQALVLTVGALRVMEGELTMGTLVAFQSLMASFVAPVNNLMAMAAAVQEMVGSMNRLDDVLRYPAEAWETQEDETREDPGDKLTGAIELQGITFGYSRLAPPLIRDFSLSLRPGARVALVGASGSGKSTISKLICRLYEPWDGRILFDGLEPHEIPRTVFSSSVALVDQDLVLFEGSVRDNLTLWDETIPEARMIEACKDALIHDEISGRSGGYDGVLRENGANFSGGQRQRMDIARALVGDPRVLVMDEATAALDTVTEQQVDANLRRRGCTCVIVAHRLSTVRDCDEIIVLDKGEVVQRGTHDELMRDPDGVYAQLVRH